jgi:hypothetical protein
VLGAAAVLRNAVDRHDGAVLACRVLGHRVRFWAEGSVLRWSCERGCGEEGAERYTSAAAARRDARAFDREDGGGRGGPPHPGRR